MAKGRKITSEVKRLVVEVKLANPDWNAKQVQADVDKKLGGTGWPGLSAVQKILAGAFPKPKPGEAKEPGEDAPWSLGASVEYGIPPEATGALLKICRWCLAADYTLTIRQAKWVGLLRYVLPNSDPYYLYRTAWEYALRERASMALRLESLDTGDLDQRLLGARMGLAESRAARDTGKLSLPCLEQRDIEAVEAVGWKINKPQDNIWFAPSPVSAAAFVERRLGLTPSSKLSERLPEEADLVYAYWLRHISEGPKWGAMSKDQRQDIARRLQGHAVDFTEAASSAAESKASYQEFARHRKPIKILREVGYEE